MARQIRILGNHDMANLGEAYVMPRTGEDGRKSFCAFHCSKHWNGNDVVNEAAGEWTLDITEAIEDARRSMSV